MRVFEENLNENTKEIWLTEENVRHVVRVMRKQAGDKITVCDGEGKDFMCVIEETTKDSVLCKVEEVVPCDSEMKSKVTIFAGLGKGDKPEMIIQKCVELGAHNIVFFTSDNCVIKLGKGDNEKKTARYNKIARDAGKQSGRGVLPSVEPIVTFNEAVAMAKEYDLPLFLYECEDRFTLKNNLLNAEKHGTIAVITGPEGGFSLKEVEKCQQEGLVFTTLGKRILRCETAPIAALAAISAILEE